MRTSRRLHLSVALLIAIAALLAAGCGGDGGSDPDPQETLEKAFSPDGIGQLESGNLDVEAKVGVSNGGDPAKEATLSLKGPFGDDQANLTASASGVDPTSGKPISFEGGLTVTTDNLYVTYNGTPYELGAQRFAELKANAEAAPKPPTEGSLKERFSEGCKTSLEQAGATDTSACDQIDPASWATLDFDGSEDVNGADSDHFSGDIDAEKLFGDLIGLGTSALPQSQQSQIPSGLLEQIPNFIDSADIGVWVGKDDSILRKTEFNLSANLFGTEFKVGVTSDISDVNEPQSISAPANPQPLEKLRDQLPPQGQQALDCVLNAKTTSDLNGCGASLGAGSALGGGGLPL